MSFVGETPFKASVDDGSETARAEIISKIKNASIPAAIITIPSKWQEVIRGCLVADPTRPDEKHRRCDVQEVCQERSMSETVVDDKAPPKPKPKLPEPNPNPTSTPKWVYYLFYIDEWWVTF
ncbi:MAG: hypothetical protein IPL08_14065 [Saprospiraceae bacterium]|nr:hypothetical protein [Saprospiraceae bacterium]